MTIPIPAPDSLEEPTTCVRINELWIPVILGALQAFLNPPQWGLGKTGVFMINSEPIWDGDENDQFDAEQEILEIMSVFMTGNCEDDMPVMPTASVTAFAGAAAPTGWLMCDGDNYLKADYPALWTALGETFEVDTDNFAVPDLRGRAPVGTGTGGGLTARALGDSFGAETHTLTSNEMPIHGHGNGNHSHTTEAHNHTQEPHDHSTATHNHTIADHAHTVNVKTNAAAFGTGVIATSNDATPNATRNASTVSQSTGLWEVNIDPETAVNNAATVTVNANTVGLSDAGGDVAHNNMQPSLALNFIIKT